MCCALRSRIAFVVLVLMLGTPAFAAPEREVAAAESAQRVCQQLREMAARSQFPASTPSYSTTVPDEPLWKTAEREQNLEAISGRLSRQRAASDALAGRRVIVDPGEQARKTCARAQELRAALANWEDRPATPVEAVWEAVFVPIWQKSGMTNVRPAPFRQVATLDDLLDEIGIRKDARDAVVAFATAAFDTYQARRSLLVAERVCTDPSALETGEALGRALDEVDAEAAPEKERLVTGMWSALDTAPAAKVTEYAIENFQTMSKDISFFANWSRDKLAEAIGILCP